MEEQVLRNTVNSEALMTAFHQSWPGDNGNKVGEEEKCFSLRFLCPRPLNQCLLKTPFVRKSVGLFPSEHGAGEGAAVGGTFHGVWPWRSHVSHREDPEAGCYGDPRVAARGAVDDVFW